MLSHSRGSLVQWPRFTRLVIAFAVIFGLPACVVIPTGVGQKNLLADEHLDFIEIGASTKEQVATAMSKYLTASSSKKTIVNVSPLKFRDGDWWLYSQTRKEAKWAIVGIEGSLVSGEVDYRFALFKFDSKGVVAELVLSSSEGNKCNKEHICVGDSFRPQILAPILDDQTAKQFAPPKDRCGVYVYGVPYEGNALWASIRIWLDGSQVGLVVDGRQYYYWELIPGSHEVAFTNTSGTAKTARSLTCESGATYVLELDVGGGVFLESRRQTKIEIRGSLAGRTAIRRRRLTLTGS
jgi:hypothetical protein